jgi:hypothetical protein
MRKMRDRKRPLKREKRMSSRGKRIKITPGDGGFRILDIEENGECVPLFILKFEDHEMIGDKPDLGAMGQMKQASLRDQRGKECGKVLDPHGGVGGIGLEARNAGRILRGPRWRGGGRRWD